MKWQNSALSGLAHPLPEKKSETLCPKSIADCVQTWQDERGSPESINLVLVSVPDSQSYMMLPE